MDSRQQVIKHRLEENHKKQLNISYLNSTDEIKNKFNELSLNIKNTHCHGSSECIAEKVDNSQDENFQIDNRNFQIKKKTLSTEIDQTNHESNYLQNLILNFGTIFIKLCIDSGRNNIYNINEENIRLIKLGITLMFPEKSNLICFACNTKIVYDKQLLFEHLLHSKHIQNVRKMSDDNKKSKKNQNKFSNLKLAEFCLKKRLKKKVHCYVCNYNITNKNILINLHIKSKKHVLQSKIWKEQSIEILKEFLIIFDNAWYYAQVYICAICEKRFDLEIKFAKHLVEMTHLKNIKKFECNGILTEFHLCPICVTCWFGESNSYSLHCKSQFHKYIVIRKDFMVSNITTFVVDLLNNIDQNLTCLLNESNKEILENNKESEVLQAVEESMKYIYPKVKTFIFGSRLSKLSFPDSNLNIFLDCDNFYSKCIEKEKILKYIFLAKECFKRKPNIWIINEIILNTRVPIIKLNHIPTCIKVDISFHNGLGVETSILIR
jgi:hypothetical protein